MSYINTDTDAYPVTRATIEAAFPTVIWADSAPPAPYKPVLEALSKPTPADGELLVEGAPELVSGVWRETWTAEESEDAPRRLIPKSIIQERVNDIGKLELVLTALESQAILYARWFAPDWPNVYYNDGAMLFLLGAVGCTSEEIAVITAPV